MLFFLLNTVKIFEIIPSSTPIKNVETTTDAEMHTIRLLKILE